MNKATFIDVCLYEAGIEEGRLEGFKLGLEAAAKWHDTLLFNINAHINIKAKNKDGDLARALAEAHDYAIEGIRYQPG